jgi:hypothetical protein
MHLFTRFLGRTNIRHVFGQLDQTLKVIRIDDSSNSTASARQEDGLVAGLSAVDDGADISLVYA